MLQNGGAIRVADYPYQFRLETKTWAVFKERTCPVREMVRGETLVVLRDRRLPLAIPFVEAIGVLPKVEQ
jgi:hypothetical protein